MCQDDNIIYCCGDAANRLSYGCRGVPVLSVFGSSC